MNSSKTNLLDEVIEANRTFLAEAPVPRPTTLGDGNLLVLTCVDPRITDLLPRAMGVATEEMIQVRNAGNSVTRDDSESVRSLCALLVLGQAEEVFVVGHTDCRMCGATAMSLLDGMAKRGMSRDALGGADVRETFGGIASERSNVLDAARAIRRSPLLPPGTPVHALLVDTATGKLDTLENGYRVVPTGPKRSTPTRSSTDFRRAPTRPRAPDSASESFEELPKPPGPVKLAPISEVEPSRYNSGPTSQEPEPPLAEEPAVELAPELFVAPVVDPPREPGPEAEPAGETRGAVRPAQQEAAARGFVPPKPPPVPPRARRSEPVPEPVPEPERPRYTQPARKPAKRGDKQEDEPTSPFERAEDVLKRLMQRRRK